MRELKAEGFNGAESLGLTPAEVKAIRLLLGFVRGGRRR
jgi:hypothetical protein